MNDSRILAAAPYAGDCSRNLFDLDVGGFDHNTPLMGQAGFLEHDDTVHGIRMFAREVYPQLKAFYPGTAISGFPQLAARTAADL